MADIDFFGEGLDQEFPFWDLRHDFEVAEGADLSLVWDDIQDTIGNNASTLWIPHQDLDLSSTLVIRKPVRIIAGGFHGNIFDNSVPGWRGGVVFRWTGAAGGTMVRFTSPDLTANVIQYISTTGGPTGGSVRLSFDGQITGVGAIPYNATAAQVRSALEALSNIDPGDVTVTGGPWPAQIIITFTGQYALTRVHQLKLNTNSLTGGASPSVSIIGGTPLDGGGGLDGIVCDANSLATTAFEFDRMRYAAIGQLGVFGMTAGGGGIAFHLTAASALVGADNVMFNRFEQLVARAPRGIVCDGDEINAGSNCCLNYFGLVDISSNGTQATDHLVELNMCDNQTWDQLYLQGNAGGQYGVYFGGRCRSMVMTHCQGNENGVYVADPAVSGDPGNHIHFYDRENGQPDPTFQSSAGILYWNTTGRGARGINTPHPISHRKQDKTLANGVNNDVTIRAGLIRITGPTGAFSIASILVTITTQVPNDGMIVTLLNVSGQAMTITNAAVTGTATGRILTATAANRVQGVAANPASITLQYDSTTQRWREVASVGLT